MSDNELEIKQKPSLEDRLGTGPVNHGRDIYINELRSVSMMDYDTGKQMELPLDDFIKKLSSDIENGGSFVKYDKETNKFYLVEVKKSDGFDYTVLYEIDMNKLFMEDYANGKYYDITLKLHGLKLRSDEKSKVLDREKSDEERLNDIIAKVNSSHEQLTPLEARLYLDHLRKQDRKNAKDLAKSSAKLTAVAGVPLAAGVAAGAICFAPAALGITALAGLLGVTAGGLAEGTFNMFVGDYPTLELLPINHAKSIIKDIKEKMGQRRNNKAKERELRKINGVDNLIMPNSVTIEEQMAVEPLQLEDPINSQFDDLINAASRINNDAKDSVLDRIHAAIGRYETRKKAIENGTNTDGDNLTKLRNDACREIAKFEIEIKGVQRADSKTNATTKEADLLRNKIDRVKKFEFLDNTDEELEAMMDEVQEVEETPKTSAK